MILSPNDKTYNSILFHEMNSSKLRINDNFLKSTAINVVNKKTLEAFSLRLGTK